MEKRKPHYDLKLIIAQMTDIESMNMTQTAVEGIRKAGMLKTDALDAIKNLSGADFYKSMTTYKCNKTWQDVYHSTWLGKLLYIKFQQAGEYFIVSFKER